MNIENELYFLHGHKEQSKIKKTISHSEIKEEQNT